MDSLDSNTIKMVRNYLELSQMEMSERIGVSLIAYQRWEQGKAAPRPYYRRLFRDLFGQTLDTLREGDKEEQGTSTAMELIVNTSLLSLEMLMMSRRVALQSILNAACASLMLSPHALLPQDVDRLQWSMNHSYIDEEALDILSSITKSYWRISKNASIDVLSGISGHFATIAQLLKESHPTPIYNRLCGLISENALLLGKTFHDIKEYDLAGEYYRFALRVAQDSDNLDLWANGVGRIALLFIYWGEPQNALPFLQLAQKKEIQNQLLKPWLRAIEAEIYAMRGDVNAMHRALDLSKLPSLPNIAELDTYGTGYNPSRAAGYEGSCFVRLHQPERALPALQQALTLCEPTSLRRHSTLIADIGTVYAQLGDVNAACRLINKSLEITDQTKSLVVLQRVYKARRDLEPWKDSPEVKNLDEHIAKTFASLTKIKEQI